MPGASTHSYDPCGLYDTSGVALAYRVLREAAASGLSDAGSFNELPIRRGVLGNWTSGESDSPKFACTAFHRKFLGGGPESDARKQLDSI